MSRLVPARLETLLGWALAEFEREHSVFGLPRRSMWRGEPALDLAVATPGGRADNPLGIAAGPHTQLAHNIVAGWLAGARSLELKTVQAQDRIEVPRPCIDAPAETYNVEWSQELTLEQSLEQYVSAWCLVHALAARGLAGPRIGDDVRQGAGLTGTRFEASVGYDLAGIRSRPVARFLDRLVDAGETIAALRDRLPAPLRAAMEIPIPSRVIDTVTLSTFHGCPPEEIEGIVEHLFARHRLHVVVKLNPTLLGRDAVADLLHERLGYHHLALDPEAFVDDLSWQTALELLMRLSTSASRRGLTLGVKLTNTLVIRNPGRGLAGHRVYLSGPPLHPIAMALAERLVRASGGTIPIAFSGGVCAENFADTVACGFAPVTVCSDLLQPNGYRRLPRYLKALTAELARTGARTIREYREVHGRELAGPGGQIGAAGTSALDARVIGSYASRAAGDSRYRARPSAEPAPARPPLPSFDCESCNLCTLACPNGAMVSIASAPRQVASLDLELCDGQVLARPASFEIQRDRQWVVLADFCNACGNCDTFCPQDGGPFRMKPSFHGSRGAYLAGAPEDGILLDPDGGGVRARFGGVEHRLERCGAGWRFSDGVLEATLDSQLQPLTTRVVARHDGHVLSLARAHALRLWAEASRGEMNAVAAVAGAPRSDEPTTEASMHETG